VADRRDAAGRVAENLQALLRRGDPDLLAGDVVQRRQLAIVDALVARRQDDDRLAIHHEAQALDDGA